MCQILIFENFYNFWAFEIDELLGLIFYKNQFVFVVLKFTGSSLISTN